MREKWALLGAFLANPNQDPEIVYRDIRQSEEFMPEWLKSATLTLKGNLTLPSSRQAVSAAEQIIKADYWNKRLD